MVVKKGDGEILGLTDRELPRRLAPKWASKFRKLFNMAKEDVLAVALLLDRDQKRPLIDRATADGMTALAWAAHNGRLEVMECLLDRGAEVNCVTPTGNTALIGAASNGKWAAVRLLLERGAGTEYYI